MSSKRLATNNNQLPEGYKKTEVGVIPDDWKCEHLRDKIVITHGFGFKSQYFCSQGLYWLTTPGNFYEDGGFREIGEKQKYYNGPLPDIYLLQHGDLIVAMTEQAEGLLGSAAIIPKSGTYLHNQRLGKIQPISLDIELFFLYYIFNSKNFRLKVRETAAGTKVKHTSPTKLLEIATPLPPLPEQKAIAQTLSDVDALIASLDKLIAKKRNIKTGTMQQLLTGKTRLPGFGGEWENITVGDLFEITAGGDLVKSEYSEIQTNTYPYPIFANSVINGGLYGYSSFEEYKGDCITITARGTLGFACYRHTSFVAIGRLLVLSPRLKLDTFFFAEAINHQIQFANESTSVPQLTAPQTAQYRLSIPKLEEQKAITQVLSDIDSEITALEKRRAKTQAIKQGMMQELLTGRTRIIDN